VRVAVGDSDSDGSDRELHSDAPDSDASGSDSHPSDGPLPMTSDSQGDSEPLSDSDSNHHACLSGCDATLVAALDGSRAEWCAAMLPLFESECVDPCRGTEAEAVLLPRLVECGICALTPS
jgi:hypothetical protein